MLQKNVARIFVAQLCRRGFRQMERKMSNDSFCDNPCGTDCETKKTSTPGSTGGTGTISREALFDNIAPPVEAVHNKVTIVGAGQVGIASAFAILAQDITSDLALVDVSKERLQGETMDLQHGSMFLKHSAHISSSPDFSVSAGSRVCVVTAGARQREGEDRLSLVQRNTDIMKGIVTQLLKHSPDAILLIVSNPVDILSYVSWKISGLPKNRIVGSGTNLDTSRFRFQLSKKLNVTSGNCHGWIIGEHGDSSVVVWSAVNVGGVHLAHVYPEIKGKPKGEWSEIHKEVIQGAYHIIKLKGYTSWAIALSIAQLVRSILENSRSIHAVSLHIQGYHGIKEDVFLSLPAILDGNGVTDVVKLRLSEYEQTALQKSAALMAKIISGLKM